MKLITPVGTSLFTNFLDKNGGDNTFSNDYKTIRSGPDDDWDLYNSEIKRLRISSLEFIKKEKKSASAELQSIAQIQDKLEGDLEVHLLASDTIASRLAAEILADATVVDAVLGDSISVTFDVENDVIKGLQVEDPKVFSNEGMTNLIRKIEEKAEGFWPALAINITGGYKATLPYLTILSQVKRIPLYYNFEDTDTLITIPQAPLAIDFGLIERRSDVLREIDEKEIIKNWLDFKNQHYRAVQDLEAFIEIYENIAVLSPIGKIFWEEYQRYFIVELPGGSYYSYDSDKRQSIDVAIKELYGRLDTVLSDTCLLDSNGNRVPEKCYEKIRNLGSSDDLYHGGQIRNLTDPKNLDRKIFIFKSTNHDHIRLLYTFEVKKQRITRLRIFDVLCEKFDHSTYIADWKNKFGDKNFPDINFVTRTFEIPS